MGAQHPSDAKSKAARSATAATSTIDSGVYAAKREAALSRLAPAAVVAPSLAAEKASAAVLALSMSESALLLVLLLLLPGKMLKFLEGKYP